MQKLNKTIHLLFGFALGLSIGMPCGILGIIFGAVYTLVPLLVGGLVLTVGGFYAMPILWVQYGEKRALRNMLRMILEQNLYTVADLAAQLGLEEKVTAERISYMIRKGYLTGFLFRDGYLELNTYQKQMPTGPAPRKCQNCGAPMVHDGEKYLCEYCRSTYVGKGNAQ